ncbi:hypothetical protein LCGC14_2176730 [marine sediment metagenome]|uniref:Uncharacterized protein n=2 Tax=root TaxID=1 RepID=A0A831VZ51_9GAMM|nr:hypothetical protein [Marinobacter antarcticus]HEA53251.1 hypothetical protein [Marinobacter antarcticus]
MDTEKGLPTLSKGLKACLIATLALVVVLVLINQPLKTGSAHQGIVSYQLAGNAEQAWAIVQSWGSNGLQWARLSLWVDFLFVPLYCVTLIMLTRHCILDRPGVRERTTARWIQTLFVSAGLADITENALLLNNLEAPTDAISLAAAISALIKFTALTLGIAGLVIIRASRRHPLVPG